MSSRGGLHQALLLLNLYLQGCQIHKWLCFIKLL
jgi:hypothetical protein